MLRTVFRLVILRRHGENKCLWDGFIAYEKFVFLSVSFFLVVLSLSVLLLWSWSIRSAALISTSIVMTSADFYIAISWASNSRLQRQNSQCHMCIVIWYMQQLILRFWWCRQRVWILMKVIIVMKVMQGVLQVSKHDLIEGQMNGNLISGEVRLSNAVFKKCLHTSSPLTPVGQSLSEYEILFIWIV